MKKITLAIGLSFSLLNAATYSNVTGDSVVLGDTQYFTHSEDNITLIFTKEHLPFAKHVAQKETSIHKKYQNLYNWELDEELYVGLISKQNQIANGFSTQWPYNRQINYIGGTTLVDEFASRSWLNALIYHETAHNYQANIKGSVLSQYIYKFFKHGTFLTELPLSTPNAMENSFILEGNAVLHESIHGNGGRLYNGSYKAQTIIQAKAGKLNAAELYNVKDEFPYGDIVYIQGGFYQLYMAQKYGIKKLNSYLTYHSQDLFWPQFTNTSMYNAVGIDFEDSINNFSNYYKKLGEHFHVVKGKTLFTSQFYFPLSKQNGNIFFLTQELAQTPILNNINLKNLQITKEHTTLLPAKVIKIADKYFTNSSSFTSPTQITQGLFDNNAKLLQYSNSKVVQGFLSDNSMVYFDVKSSYAIPQLYIDEKFYAQVNSSVLIDKKDNLYYFVQKGKTRTLFKNKTPLYSFEGFYGKVADVDKFGNIYFIANSQLGSTLYKYVRGNVLRVSKADNIKDAKIIDKNRVLLVAIGANKYYYSVNNLVQIAQQPYATKLFFEKKDYYGTSVQKETKQKNKVTLDNSYNALLDMHYSGTDFMLGHEKNYGLNGSVAVKFADPLTQNSLAFYSSKDILNTQLFGFEYESSLSIFHFNINGYKTIHSENEYSKEYGVMLHTQLPLYKSGYVESLASLEYFDDYQVTQRKPITFNLSLEKSYQYAGSLFPNYLQKINFIGVKERDTLIMGWEYKFIKSLPYLFYVGSEIKSSFTNAQSSADAKGVKLSSLDVMYDPSTIVIPNMSYNGYAKSAMYGEVKLAKVFNFSKYFFTFPISLKHEVLYTKYRYYSLKNFKKEVYTMNEFQVGLTFSNVYLNSFTMPVTIKYTYDDGAFIEDHQSLRFNLGMSF